MTMARRANISLSGDEDEDEPQSISTRPRTANSRVAESHSPSPSLSFSSDKENRGLSPKASRLNNGKSRAMPPPQVPTTPSIESATPGEAKRRRLGERNNPNPSQLAHEQELQKLADKGHTQYYDPNQSMAERRRVRKGIRDLSKELTGMPAIDKASLKVVF